MFPLTSPLTSFECLGVPATSPRVLSASVCSSGGSDIRLGFISWAMSHLSCRCLHSDHGHCRPRSLSKLEQTNWTNWGAFSISGWCFLDVVFQDFLSSFRLESTWGKETLWTVLILWNHWVSLLFKWGKNLDIACDVARTPALMVQSLWLVWVFLFSWIFFVIYWTQSWE